MAQRCGAVAALSFHIGEEEVEAGAARGVRGGRTGSAQRRGERFGGLGESAPRREELAEALEGAGMGRLHLERPAEQAFRFAQVAALEAEAGGAEQGRQVRGVGGGGAPVEGVRFLVPAAAGEQVRQVRQRRARLRIAGQGLPVGGFRFGGASLPGQDIPEVVVESRLLGPVGEETAVDRLRGPGVPRLGGAAGAGFPAAGVFAQVLDGREQRVRVEGGPGGAGGGAGSGGGLPPGLGVALPAADLGEEVPGGGRRRRQPDSGLHLGGGGGEVAGGEVEAAEADGRFD